MLSKSNCVHLRKSIFNWTHFSLGLNLFSDNSKQYHSNDVDTITRALIFWKLFLLLILQT